MRRATLFGVGAVLVSALCDCSGDDPAPGSKISQSKAGSGGTGGEAGSLNLGISGGGTGGGGAGGTGGASGGSSGGETQGGTPAGGTASHAGSSNGGSGGTKPMGMCKRATATDADCLDFYPATPATEDEPAQAAKSQAYSCDDPAAYITLNGKHAGKCANVNFVAGAKYGACCPL